MRIRDNIDQGLNRFFQNAKTLKPFLPCVKGILIYGIYLGVLSCTVPTFRSAFSSQLPYIAFYDVWLAVLSFLISVAILYSVMLTFALHSHSERLDFNERYPQDYHPKEERQYILHSKVFLLETAVIWTGILLHPLSWSHDVLFFIHPIINALPYIVKKLIVSVIYFAFSALLNLSARMEARKAWGVISSDLYKERLWQSIRDKKQRRFGYTRMLLRLLTNFAIFLLASNFLPSAIGIIASVLQIVSLFALTGSVIAAVVIIVSIFYLRAILKRASFIKRLKKTCREQDYALFDLKRPYRSIFRDNHSYTFGVEGHGKTYFCRVIASVKRGNYITFSSDGGCTRTFSLRLPTPRVAVRGRIVNMEESSEPHGYEIARFSSEIDYTFETEQDGMKILILNPVSAKVYYEKKGKITDIDHGMSIGDYKIYTASSFLYALELDCVDKVEQIK
ncbi:MAG: hypothetical protein IJX80_03440 [Clostridia bacterium]|nr:hypothetical protein [Clostridia bacterium]